MTENEQRTEDQIRVRQVTHVQASRTERERGEAGAFTFQLILDNGADEYMLRPTAEDAGRPGLAVQAERQRKLRPRPQSPDLQQPRDRLSGERRSASGPTRAVRQRKHQPRFNPADSRSRGGEPPPSARSGDDRVRLQAALTIPVLFLVVTLIFFMMRSIGGDPFRHGPLLGLNAGWLRSTGTTSHPPSGETLRSATGSTPWHEQYLNFLQGVVTFDYGPSCRSERAGERHPQGAGAALARPRPAGVRVGACLGLPLGVFAVPARTPPRRRRTPFLEHRVWAVPNFLIATILIYVVSVKLLGWLPTNGWQESWRHKILPSFTLSLVPMAYFRAPRARSDARGARAGLRAGGPSARAAPAARGRPARATQLPHPGGHGLRPLLGYLVTGSFVVEAIFSGKAGDRPLLRRLRAGPRLHRRARDHRSPRARDRAREPRRRPPARASRPARPPGSLSAHVRWAAPNVG